MCKFLAYIFAISAYEASNACMSVQMCYKTISHVVSSVSAGARRIRSSIIIRISSGRRKPPSALFKGLRRDFKTRAYSGRVGMISQSSFYPSPSNSSSIWALSVEAFKYFGYI